MEPFWSGRADYPVQHRHRTLLHVLNLAAVLGVPFAVWGLVALDPWPTTMGMVLMIGGKLWYINRMALLYEDMVGGRPDLRYAPGFPNSRSK